MCSWYSGRKDQDFALFCVTEARACVCVRARALQPDIRMLWPQTSTIVRVLISQDFHYSIAGDN